MNSLTDEFVKFHENIRLHLILMHELKIVPQDKDAPSIFDLMGLSPDTYTVAEVQPAHDKLSEQLHRAKNQGDAVRDIRIAANIARRILNTPSEARAYRDWYRQKYERSDPPPPPPPPPFRRNWLRLVGGIAVLALGGSLVLAGVLFRSSQHWVPNAESTPSKPVVRPDPPLPPVESPAKIAEREAEEAQRKVVDAEDTLKFYLAKQKEKNKGEEGLSPEEAKKHRDYIREVCEQAEALAEHAIALDPKNRLAYLEQGNARYYTEDFAGAEKTAQTALQLFGQDAKILDLLKRAQKKLGRR